MKKSQTHSTKSPRKLEVVETIDNLEDKYGKPDIETLRQELSRKHGREYSTEEIRQQISWLEKTPSSHKVVNKSLIGKKLSLTTYGRQLLN